MSGRNLTRYLRVLRASPAVQDLLRDRLIPLVLAEKLADVEQDLQAAIVERICAGEPARRVVADLIPLRDGQTRRALHTGVTKLIRDLKCANDIISKHITNLTHLHMSDATATTLQKGKTLIEEILARRDAVQDIVSDT